MGVKAGAKAIGAAGAARGQRAAGGGRAAVGGPRGAQRRPPAWPPGQAAAPRERPAASPARAFDPAADWRAAVRATVQGLRYELVDVERAPQGLLRVTIDRLEGHAYATPGAAVTVDDCEAVTRQLQYALEVDGVDYARLEVSSPGLDRPLRTAADYERFSGLAVRLTLKAPLQGRKHFQGVLGRAEGGWQLVFEDGKGERALSFTLDEVREARLVPVLDFKGRKAHVGAPQAPAQGDAAAVVPLAGQDAAQRAAKAPRVKEAAKANEVDGGSTR